MLEQPQLVNDHLVMLLQQCAYGRDGGRRRWWRRVMTVELPAESDTLPVRSAGSVPCSRPGDLVLLAGPLGAGKTVLARGIAEGLGVTGRVSSPTFIIAREHRPAPGGRGIPLVHVDAYRLGGDLAQLDDLDLDTELVDAAVVIEWGEGAGERLSEDHLLVRLDAPRGRRPAGDAGPARQLGGARYPVSPFVSPLSSSVDSRASGRWSHGRGWRSRSGCRPARHPRRPPHCPRP